MENLKKNIGRILLLLVLSAGILAGYMIGYSAKMIIYVSVFCLAVTIIYWALSNSSSRKKEKRPEISVKGCNFDWYYNTTGDCYEISTAQELFGLGYLVNIKNINFEDKTIMQMSNISLKGYNWIPIGEENEFRGTYDGNGFKIKAMRIHEDDKILSITGDEKELCIGLFGICSGKIQSVNLEYQISTKSDDAYEGYIGGICANLDEGVIVNCVATGSISGVINLKSKMDIGGIVGTSKGDVVNSTFSGNTEVKTKNKENYKTSISLGGIAGCNKKNIKNCAFEGKFDVKVENKSFLGGIAGVNDGIIEDCTSDGTITTCDKCDIQNCVGGIAGITTGKISNSMFDGKVSGQGETNLFVGGIVADMKGGIISNCKANGNVFSTGDSIIGGAIGIASGEEENYIEKLSVNVVIKLENAFKRGVVGGMIGSIENGKVSNSYAITEIYCRGESNEEFFAGGAFGSMENTEIQDSYVVSNICNTVKDLGKDKVGSVSGRYRPGKIVRNVYVCEASRYSKNWRVLDIRPFSDIPKELESKSFDVMKLKSNEMKEVEFNFYKKLNSTTEVWGQSAFNNDSSESYPYILGSPSSNTAGAKIIGKERLEEIKVKDVKAYITVDSDNKFKPNSSVTKGELCMMISKIDEKYDDTAEYENSFTDVPSWLKNPVGFCLKYSILRGTEENLFKPNKILTKSDLVVALVRFKNIEFENKSSDFIDVVGKWYEPYIGALEEKGYIQMPDSCKFEPEKPITRAAAVSLINLVTDRAPNKEKMDNIKLDSIFSDVTKMNWYCYDALVASQDHIREDWH